MKVIVTEADRRNVRRILWQRVKGLDLPRRDRLLLADKLELDYWDSWRKAQAKEEGYVR